MAKLSHNPYEYQEPLLPGGAGVLLERTRQLQQSLQLLQRGGFLTVSAPPRTGVTTFLFALKRAIPHSVYIDLANISVVDDPPREAARILAKEVRSKCPALSVPEHPASVGDVLDVLARGAGETGEGAAHRLAVIVDGFDTWKDEPARKLVLAFRAGYTEARTFGVAGAGAGAFSIITGSSVDLRDLTATGRTSPLNIAQFIFLPDFEPADVRLLLSHTIGTADDKKLFTLARTAFDWTAGHPALTQMVAHFLHEHDAVTAADERALWQSVITAAREAATHLLASTLGLLGERPELRRTATDVYSGNAVPCDRIHRPIRELVHLGLIKSDEQGMARPRNRLFEHVLSQALNLKSTHTSVSLWNTTTNVPVLPARTNVAGDVEMHRESTGASISVHASTQTDTPREVLMNKSLPVINPDSVEAPAAATKPVERDRPADSSTDDPVARSLRGDDDNKPLVPENTEVGGCRILRRIGKGGMAEVYLAKHLALDMDVAIKILRQLPDGNRRIAQRFLREARAAAQLSHENIVQIRNVGRDGDYQFIEMEYLAGGSVADLLQYAPYRDVANGVRMLRGAAAGVQAAHAKGIIHRDIKPDNLMLAADGRIKVVDFGLAAIGASHPLAQGSSSRLTSEGVILGTPHYMAPEQWEGKEVDERSDVYSLGATFYHLFSGRTPYDGRSALELINNFANRAPAMLVRFNPDLPVSLCHAVSKMIEKDPTKRYANIEQMLADPHGLGCGTL